MRFRAFVLHPSTYGRASFSCITYTCPTKCYATTANDLSMRLPPWWSPLSNGHFISYKCQTRRFTIFWRGFLYMSIGMDIVFLWEPFSNSFLFSHLLKIEGVAIILCITLYLLCTLPIVGPRICENTSLISCAWRKEMCAGFFCNFRPFSVLRH